MADQDMGYQADKQIDRKKFWLTSGMGTLW